MKITPLGKRVLVAENKVENTTASGIILDAATSTRDSKTGTVVAVGPDVTLVEVGQKILLDWGKANVVKIGEDQRVVIEQDHIVAIIN